MRKQLFVAIAAVMCMAPSAPSTRVVEGGGVVAGSINAIPARIRIDPGALAIPLISADIAREAGLKPSFMAFTYKVGPHAVEGSSAVGMIDTGTGATKRRIGWTANPVRAGADGVVGPGMLKEDVIHFRLREQRPGEQRVEFPLVDQGGMEARWGERYALLRIGGRELRVQFDPAARDTLANAQTGAILAALLNGAWDGSPREAPIAFGIRRPVRPLKLDRPLEIGLLRLTRILVRTHDFGSSESIPDAAADPNEIVVTGSKARNAKEDIVRLGGDALDRCSSITFDKRAKRVTLSCV